jgi:hypothetical protein
MDSMTKHFVYPIDKTLYVSSDEKQRVNSLQKFLLLSMQSYTPSKKSSLEKLEESLSKFTTFLAHESQTRYPIDQLCLSGILDQFISQICAVQAESVAEVGYVTNIALIIIRLLSSAMAFIENLLAKKEAIDYICQSPTFIPIQLLDLLSSMIPFCAYNRPTSAEILATTALMRILRRLIDHCTSSDFLSRIAQNIIRFAAF